MSEYQDPPEGYYKARATGEDEPHVVFGTSDNGNQQVAIEMMLIDLNRTVMVILNFSDAAAPFSLERLRALGWKGGDSMTGITTNEVQVRAKNESWTSKDGQTKTGMKFEIMTGQGRFSFQKPMDEKEKRGFFSRLNEIAKQSGAKNGGGPAAAGGGYPADWDKPSGGKARVDLG